MLGNERQKIARRYEYWGLNRIGRYLVHGFVFSIMMLVASIVLAMMLAMLIVLASFLGFIIWFALVFLTWGWVNGILCSRLWDFEVGQHWTSLIGHGFALFLILLIVGLPVSALLQFVTAGISPRIYLPIQIVFLSIFDGIIGKEIGGMFKESYEPAARPHRVLSRKPTGRRERCPFCGVSFPYRDQDINSEGAALCRGCGAILQDPRYPIGESRRPQSTPQGERNRSAPSRD